MNRADLLIVTKAIKIRSDRLLRESATLLAEVQDVLLDDVDTIMDVFVVRRLRAIQQLLSEDLPDRE